MIQIEELTTVIWQSLLLPCAAAAAACYLVLRLLPKHGIALAGLAAVALGFYAASSFNSAVQFRLNSERPITVSELGRVAYLAVTNPRGEPKPPTYYWFPWIGLLAGVVGLITRPAAVPRWLAWALRITVAAVAARLLTYDLPVTWPCIALASTMLAMWHLIEDQGKAYPGFLLPATVAIAFFAASSVILHANSARFSEIALMTGACWLGIAAASWRRAADGGGAAGIAAVLLPGIMLVAHTYLVDYSDVPDNSFLLAGTAPLALAFAALCRKFGGTSPRVLLLAAIAVVGLGIAAVVLASRAAPLTFE